MRAFLVWFFLVAGSIWAQRPVDPHNVEAGEQRYVNLCAGCHGADGDHVPGIDLGHGKFRHAETDQQLVDIILHGIPGAGMPANTMPESQAYAIVTYLRFMAESASKNTSHGDIARGKAIFQGQGGCRACHRVKGEGSRLGPDLSEVGRLRRSADLERSILDPDAQVLPAHRFVRVVTSSGTVVTGRLLNHGAFTVELMDPQENLRSFDKSELREFGFLRHSPMPSFRGKLNQQEIADLVSYLATLKGVN